MVREAFKNPNPFFQYKKNFSKNSFFPAVVMEWNKTDVNIDLLVTFLIELY